MIKNKILSFSIFTLFIIGIFVFFRTFLLNSLPVFVDEAIYVRWSQVMKNEPSLRFLPLSDGKQPLFMWSTIPFFKIFTDPLIAGRMVSVASGFGSLVGLGVLGWLVFQSPLIGFFSALIYAILPYSVFFDRMALADSMLAMFGIWSLVFSYLFVQSAKAEHAMYLGFTLGAALLTKSPAVFFYLWVITTLIIFGGRNLFKKADIGKYCYGLLLILLISQGMYAVLRLGVGFNMIGSRNYDYVYELSEVFSHPLQPLLENMRRSFTWLLMLFTPTILILMPLGVLYGKFKKQYLYLILVAALPLVAQGLVAKVYTSRYALYAVLPLIPLASAGLAWLFQRKGSLIRFSAILFLAVPIILSSVYVSKPAYAPMPYDMHTGYLEEWTAGWGQRQIAEYLIQKAEEGNKIVVFTEGFFGTLPDGLQIYTQDHPQITIVGSNPIVTEVPLGLRHTSPENLRFFVVNKSRNHLKPDDLSLFELVTEYSKPPRMDGTNEVLQFFRLK